VFLDKLITRNRGFLEAVAKGHQSGDLPTNCYAIDLDTVRSNAALLRKAADVLGLQVLAMTKQMGRNPDYCKAIREGGITEAVAVDHECAIYSVAGGLTIGHIGHLVQIPRQEIPAAMKLSPDMWTVFNKEQAQGVAAAARSRGITQRVSLRVWDESCTFYPGHAGGIHIDAVEEFSRWLQDQSGVQVGGVTSFPALLFNTDAKKLELTPNARVIKRAAEMITNLLQTPITVNMPGTTGREGLSLLAEAGATQVEPGHGLTGTTPLSVFEDTDEIPAACYVTEVAHHHQGEAYVIGGGLYMDPVLGPTSTRAVVLTAEGDMATFDVDMPAPGAIDYYARLQPDARGVLPPVGSTVIFGFRAQVFVTRGLTAGISGITSGSPTFHRAWGASGAASALAGASR
jgi:predicted amino acid racemase